MGAELDSTAQNAAEDLVVARPEAVYFYSVDGRGPCFVFEGAIDCSNLSWLLIKWRDILLSEQDVFQTDASQRSIRRMLCPMTIAPGGACAGSLQQSP